ncbi:hypothetical protein BDY24DRAFT_412029 [Mrakia frigida]|uniref:uncharacterized protein n=1 Tax=Mrakia frigida TaxID=29902 RepID=UPI003FCC0B7A
MPISPFTSSSESFPRSPSSPFGLRRKTFPPPRTSLLGRLALPRLPRRLLLLLGFISFILYLSTAFSVHDSLSAPLSQLVAVGRTSGDAKANLGEWLTEREDGSVIVRKSGGKKQGHPIRELMKEAKQKWEKQLSRQSKTLAQAEATYKLRYGRSPPKGFDAWWKFAKLHDVVIVDDYDSIHDAITPFLALDPTLLGSRLSQLLAEAPFSYQLDIRRHAPVNITGERATAPRPLEMAQFFEGFRQFLPEDFGEGSGDLGDVGGDAGMVRLSASDHDLGGNIMGEEFRTRMMDLGSRGKHVNRDELRNMEDVNRKGAMSDGLLNACSWTSPVGVKLAAEQDVVLSLDEGSDEAPKKAPVAFIRDPLKSFDFCRNPSLINFHGTYSHNQPRSPRLDPQLVLSKYVQSNQILMTPLEAFQNVTIRIPWEDKSIDKIFWRGSTTGDSFSKRDDYNWRNSHRIRLHALANARRGHTDVLIESPSRRIAMKRVQVRDLNEHLMDVGISSIGQCSEEDGTCAVMRKEIQLAGVVFPHETLQYRYAFDIDGNGWSSRFRRLIASGNVVFKMTIFPEWNTEWITPWLHYVPVSVDLSDLYHSSTFFIGAPGVTEGNEDLSRSIGNAGADFAEKHWRWEDMQSYMFRLLLEYRRAMAHDRDAMSLGGSMLA